MSVFWRMRLRLAQMQYINTWVALAGERVCDWEITTKDALRRSATRERAVDSMLESINLFVRR
jgi:hypothetical protein